MSNQDIPYYKVAKQALMNWNGLSEEQANQVVETSNFEELEGQVYAAGSMNYSLAEIMQQAGIEPEQQWAIKDAVFGSPNLDETGRSQQFESLHASIQRQGIDPNQLILDTLSAVHDGWVKDNAKQYFTKKADRQQQYQFSPLELIGWKEVKSDLLFVRPILEACNIEVDEKALEELYYSRVSKFLQDHQISNSEDLSEKLTQGADFYPALEGQDTISEALSNPEFVTGTIVPQLEEKGIGNVERFTSKEDKKISPQDIETAVEGVTKEGMNRQSAQIREEFSASKDQQQSNDEVSI